MKANTPFLYFAVTTLIGLGISHGEIIHKYDATAEDQTAEIFTDDEIGEDWSLVGALLEDIVSPFTDLNKGYILELAEAGSGGDATPFPVGDITYELWVRPSALDDDHQVIFETGGGQNGTGILMTATTVRLINSSGDTRGFDVEVPLDAINLADMVQIVASQDSANGTITVHVRGSAGGSASATGEGGTVGRGGNRASLFTWGSGAGNFGSLAGIVYTDADAAPGTIPDPSSWGLNAVPEPSTEALAFLVQRRCSFGDAARRFRSSSSRMSGDASSARAK